MPSRLKIINKRVLCPEKDELVEVKNCLKECTDNVQFIRYEDNMMMCKKGHKMIYEDKD